MSKRKGAFRDRIDSILADEEPVKKPAPKRKPSTRRAARVESAGGVEEIALSQVKARSGAKVVAADKALKLSVARRGVIQPLVVRPVGRGYEVVDGAQRLAAAKAAGLKTVPALVRVMSDAEARAFVGGAEAAVVAAPGPAATSRAKASARRRGAASDDRTFGDDDGGFEPVSLPLPGEEAEADALAHRHQVAVASARAGGQVFQFYFFLILVAGFSFSVANLVLIKDTTLGVQSGIGVLAGLVILAVLLLVRRS